MALLAELVVSTLGQIASPFAANLPGVNVRNYPLAAERWVFTVNTAGVALFLALATVEQSVGELAIWPLLLPGLLALLVGGAVLVDALLRLKSRRAAERMLPQVLAAYGRLPSTGKLHPDHRTRSRCGCLISRERPYLVVLRTPATFAETVALASVPVLVRATSASWTS
jgi:hypothetical protein